MNALRLKRVVPIVLTRDWGGADLILVSLEIYDDGSILRYRSHGRTPRGWSPLADGGFLAELKTSNPLFWVEDNLGTEYTAMLSGGGGAASNLEGQVRITPAVPDAAKTLRVAVRLPLDAGGDQIAAPRVMFEFAVS